MTPWCKRTIVEFTAETFFWSIFFFKSSHRSSQWKILQLEVSDEIMKLNYTSIIFNMSSDIMITLLRSRYENATPNLCWVVCLIGCPVQIIREVILRVHFRHTFASLWSACLRFVSLWRANSRGVSCVLGVHLSKVCWGLIFCLRKAFIF